MPAGYTVTCDDCGDEILDVVVYDNAEKVTVMDGPTTGVNEDATVLVVAHECEDVDESEDDDWDGDEVEDEEEE